jgi:hypothetical protein
MILVEGTLPVSASTVYDTLSDQEYVVLFLRV